MEILPLSITPSDLLTKFLLLVPLTLCSAGLEVLGFLLFCFLSFLLVTLGIELKASAT
jgi:hypothetical protein